MKGGAGFWVFVAVLVVLHFLLRLTFGIDVWAPDLLTLAVLLGARQLGGGAAAGLGFALGLLEDGVSLGAFGAAAITQTVIGYLGSRSRDLFVGDSILFMSLYLFLGAWLQDVLYFGVAQAVRRGEPLEMLLIHAPLQALYVAVVGLIALVVFRTVSR